MRRVTNWGRAFVVTVLAGLVGCAKEDGPKVGGDGARLAVSVKPLSLDGIGEARYTLRVYNGDPDAGGELVVEATNLLSTRFGDGRGALTYVAPCDASTGTAHVRVWLDALLDEQGGVIDEATYQNPTPLTKDAACVPNADTPVTFNITVMRDAQQGFFDIAVNFTDIFCSAKFDCQREGGGPIELLHDPLTEERGTTLVLGFACTSGANEPTYLHISDAHVECGSGPSAETYWMSPDGPSGNQGAVAPVFFETAVYRGVEQLAPYDKCYWNMAFGLSSSAPANCTLKLDATASSSSWVNADGRSPADTVYPYLRYEIPITNGAGQLACGRHPMNDGSGRVSTRYTDFDGAAFPFEWRCGDSTPTATGRVACSGDVINHGDAEATFITSPSGISVAFGPERSPAYTLPDGVSLGDGCCLNPCCAE